MALATKFLIQEKEKKKKKKKAKTKTKLKRIHDSYGYGEAYLIVMKTFIISHHSCAPVVMKDNFNILE